MTRIFLRFLLSIDITGVELLDYPVSIEIHDFKFFFARYDDSFPTISEKVKIKNMIYARYDEDFPTTLQKK